MNRMFRPPAAAGAAATATPPCSWGRSSRVLRSTTTNATSLTSPYASPIPLPQSLRWMSPIRPSRTISSTAQTCRYWLHCRSFASTSKRIPKRVTTVPLHPTHPNLNQPPTQSKQSRSSTLDTDDITSDPASSTFLVPFTAESNREAVEDSQFIVPDEPEDVSQIFGKMAINWFPGHMHAAKLALKERVSKCHLVLEVRDARIPFASGNPDFDDILGAKKRIIVFNKSDLADPRSFARVRAYYAARGQSTMFMAGEPVMEKLKGGRRDGRWDKEARQEELKRQEHAAHRMSRAQLKELHGLIQAALGPRKFASVPPVILIVGFPNVGKSTIINAFRSFGQLAANMNAAKSVMDPTKEDTKKMQKGGEARVGPTPGVTRGISGFLVTSMAKPLQGANAKETDKLFLLDTPGIMLPYIPSTPEGVELGLKLSAIHSISDFIVGDEAIVRFMLWSLNRSHLFQYVRVLSPYLRQPTNDLNTLLMAVYKKKHRHTSQHSQLFKQFTKLTREREAAMRDENSEQQHQNSDENGELHEDDHQPSTDETSTIHSSTPPSSPPPSTAAASTISNTTSLRPPPKSIGQLTTEELALCTSWFLRSFRRGEFGRMVLDHVPKSS